MNLLGSWKTNLAAAIYGICTTTDMTNLLPDDYHNMLRGICSAAVVFGFFAAKDFNKTNSQDPGEVKTVQTTSIDITTVKP